MKKNYSKLSRNILKYSKQKKDTTASVIGVRTLGNFMVISSLVLLIKTFYAPLVQELAYSYRNLSGTAYVVAGDERVRPTHKTKDYLNNAKNIEVLVPKDSEFSVVIPKIAANANVIAQVDPGNEREYLEKLKKGVAHAAGTSLPGEGGNVYLFAHSTDYIWNVNTYNAVFYLLYKLEQGDEINIFYQNKRYKYTVYDKKIVNPSEVEYLYQQPNEEIVTLQTCWPPGTALKRLLVFAKKEPLE